MTHRISRVLAVGTAAASGIGVLLVASPASAAVPTGGTSVIALSRSFAAAALRAEIIAVPTAGATATRDSATRSVDLNLPVIGGDANVDNFTGQLLLKGSLVLADGKTRKRVTVSNIQLDYITNTVTGIVPGTVGPLALFDLDGLGTSASTDTSQSFSASELDIDPAGATALNKALHTSFFVAGRTVGSFSTTYTIA